MWLSVSIEQYANKISSHIFSLPLPLSRVFISRRDHFWISMNLARTTANKCTIRSNGCDTWWWMTITHSNRLFTIQFRTQNYFVGQKLRINEYVPCARWTWWNAERSIAFNADQTLLQSYSSPIFIHFYYCAANKVDNEWRHMWHIWCRFTLIGTTSFHSFGSFIHSFSLFIIRFIVTIHIFYTKLFCCHSQSVAIRTQLHSS